MRCKTKSKYPALKYEKIPFTRREKMLTKPVITEQPRTVMDEAYEMMIQKRKSFNPEIIESALRLAMTRREEIRNQGFLAMTRSLSRVAQTKAETLDKPSSKQDEEEKKLIDKRALWNKARFLALMRAKRGTRKWAKAKNRIEQRVSKKNNNSFWFQAKKMVFPDPKDKKVIKLL